MSLLLTLTTIIVKTLLDEVNAFNAETMRLRPRNVSVWRVASAGNRDGRVAFKLTNKRKAGRLCGCALPQIEPQ